MFPWISQRLRSQVVSMLTSLQLLVLCMVALVLSFEISCDVHVNPETGNDNRTCG